MTAAGELPGARTTGNSRRGRQRKTEILEAVLRIVGRDGIAGLSMRTLAVEADIPLGATTYYFASKPKLIAEAFRLHASRETERVLAATPLLSPSPSALQLSSQLTDFVIGGLTGHRHRLIAEYELLVEATREPELATLSRTWQDVMRQQLETVLARLGSLEAAVDARLLLSLLAGLEVDHLSVELDAADVSEIRSIILRAVTALVPAAGPPPGNERGPAVPQKGPAPGGPSAADDHQPSTTGSSRVGNIALGEAHTFESARNPALGDTPEQAMPSKDG